MDFTKIKCNSNRIHLEYIERSEEDFSEYSVNSPNNGLPSFLLSMQNLAIDFLGMLELPDNAKFVKRVEIHTINISYKGPELQRSVIISGNIKTGSGSFNVNTPLQAMDNEEDKSVSVEFNQKIEQVINEARKFISGDRAQANLFHMPQTAATKKAVAAAPN
jgi:hypothetical protein